MLDERWSPEVEEIGDALRKILAGECPPEQVRKAEESEDGRHATIERTLSEFGLDELEGDAELFARIAYELGRALAPTAHVDAMPVQALLKRAGVSIGFDGPVPAALESVAVMQGDRLVIEPLNGSPRRTAAGDFLVDYTSSGSGQDAGDADTADRLSRYRALTDAARMIGAGQALLAYGADYAKEREQFGKIIGKFQGVAHRLSHAAGELDAAELLLRKAAFTASPKNGGDGAPSAQFSIMVRAKAIEAARLVAANVHQVFGGNGFAMEYDVQLYSRRLRNWANRGPRPDAQLAKLARMVLDPVRRERMAMLWHYDKGMPLPRWAQEADAAKSHG